MSLYHEAVEVLNNARIDGGSIKSIVFAKKDWKTNVKTLFALTTETAKWSAVLSEVIDKSGVLRSEKQLTPELALVLAHDLLLAKRGLALPATHGIAVAISKHRARLSAELSKVRIRQGFAGLDAWRQHVNESNGALNSSTESGRSMASRHPRWVRINALLTTFDEQLRTTFASYDRVRDLTDILNAAPNEKVLFWDRNISSLIAIRDSVDITQSVAYKNGQLLLQDKASCIPAALLDPKSFDGDIIDACAAPGNKTTHLASLISSTHAGLPPKKKRRIFACERDAQRSVTLEKMVNIAGADQLVQIKARQDFLKLDPQSKEFEEVMAILLDPSCSGSGIVGRDEVMLNVHLPNTDMSNGQGPAGKKRKRGANKYDAHPAPQLNHNPENQEEEADSASTKDPSKLATRLTALSSFQLRLLEHAMAFPAAKRITYSTCSIHNEENEHVVIKALLSDIAVARGWRLIRRDEQLLGLRKWHLRGQPPAVVECISSMGTAEGSIDANEAAEACIRCEKGSEDGTMGFFVAAFTRDVDTVTKMNGEPIAAGPDNYAREADHEDEWEGFSDEG